MEFPGMANRNVAVGGAVDERHGGSSSAQCQSRRCRAKVDAVAHSRIQKPDVDKWPGYDSAADTVLFQAVEGDLFEGNERAIGGDRTESRFSCQGLNQNGPSHG